MKKTGDIIHLKCAGCSETIDLDESQFGTKLECECGALIDWKMYPEAEKRVVERRVERKVKDHQEREQAEAERLRFAEIKHDQRAAQRDAQRDAAQARKERKRVAAETPPAKVPAGLKPCPSCEHPCSAEAATCPECGHPLKSAGAAVQNERMSRGGGCQRCGSYKFKQTAHTTGAGWGLLVIGLLFCLLIVGAIIGIPMILMSFFLTEKRNKCRDCGLTWRA